MVVSKTEIDRLVRVINENISRRKKNRPHLRQTSNMLT